MLGLLYAQYQLEKALEYAKAQIVTAGNEIMPHFKGFVGDHISAVYREYGPKYVLDDEETNEYSKVEIKYSPDTKRIDEYLEEHGELPPGVRFNENRKKSLSISTKKFYEDIDKGKVSLDSIVQLLEEVGVNDMGKGRKLPPVPKKKKNGKN